MFQQRVKNFTFSLNFPNERNTFSSGDVITGHISFELTKETTITAITMELRGRANVHWSSGGGGGGRRRRRQRRHYSAKLDFFHHRSAIRCWWDHKTSAWHACLSIYKSSPTRVCMNTFHFTDTAGGHVVGSFRDFPSSFHGVHGQIAYTLTVGINRPWHMSKDFVTELNFVNHIDTNQPELWSPLSGSNNMTLCCLWCASGPITMTATAEKKAFTPGETVKIICDFSNSSSRMATPKAKLQQKQIFYTLNKANKNMAFKSLASVTGEPIDAHMFDVHTELMLTIPSSASLTISNCSILQVDYIIEVTLSVRASPDLTVLIPIILCDTSINTQPPHNF